MYAPAIHARARDGIASHGSLCAYIRDFRASSKLFEMVTAEMLSRKHGRAFYLWEDVALEVKDARGLPHPDVGIDITDTTNDHRAVQAPEQHPHVDGHRNVSWVRPRPSRRRRGRVVRRLVGDRGRAERVLATERALRLLCKQAPIRRADHARGRRVYRLRDLGGSGARATRAGRKRLPKSPSSSETTSSRPSSCASKRRRARRTWSWSVRE